MSQTKPGIDLSLVTDRPPVKPLPAAWRDFIRFCGDLQHGEIERLSIQDGIPVIAETIKKKVKFTGGT